MESVGETCSGATASEAKVGILLDLGSPFNAAVDAKDDSDSRPTGDHAPCTTNPCPEDALGGRQEPADQMDQSANGEACPTELPAEDTRTDVGFDWEDVADENLIDNEEFDFDLPVSPKEIVHEMKTEEEEGEEDEDEVFFGPVGFTESCVAKKTQLSSLSPAECKPLSPLNAEQYVQIFLEANRVAMELERERQGSGASSSSSISGQLESPVGKPPARDDGGGDPRAAADRGKAALTNRAEAAEVPASLGDERPDTRTYKRLVRKEMRSPRRGTYTIAVSPAHAPPPSHLPSAGEQRPQQRSAAKAGGAAAQRESKLPVRGGRRSKLPTKAATKRASPLPRPSPCTSTDKLLRKKISSPPKRKRFQSGGSDDRFSEAGSSATSELSDPAGLSAGMTVGKLSQPGGFAAKGNTSRTSVGSRTTARTSSAFNKSSSKPSKANTEAAGASSLRAPAAKASLLQQGPLQRGKTLQAGRPLKLLRPGQPHLQPASKPQPMKAVVSAIKVPNGPALATPKIKTVISREPVGLRSATPSTPVTLDKKVAPKRLLSTKATPRSLSSSSASSTPRSRTVAPSTPCCSDSKLGPAAGVTGSARRRSGIPTPSRRLTSSSSTVSNPSPMRFRGQRSSTTSSTPATSPRLPKPRLRSVAEAAVKLDLDSPPSPAAQGGRRCPSEDDGRPALGTRTNEASLERNSPAIGMLIDLNSDAGMEKLSKASPMSQSNGREGKENLIDFP